jgi:hypothetical protein
LARLGSLIRLALVRISLANEEFCHEQGASLTVTRAPVAPYRELSSDAFAHCG